MAQQLQELIDKIKNEGLQAADTKAHEIERQARTKADQIVRDAELKAKQIVADAQANATKLQESTHMALQQAARDTILSLRQEILRILKQLIKQDIDQTLTPENLVGILEQVVQSFSASLKDGETVRVTLNPKDEQQLQAGLLTQLKDRLKTSLTLHASTDISKGFLISFDGGKSDFDFSDENLAQYLSVFVNDHVAGIVQEASRKS